MTKVIEIVSSDITTREWYTSLVDDCRAIIAEAVFTSRWALVEGYHALGERIREDSDKSPITKLLQDLAVSLHTSDRTLWYAVQFYDKYPRLDAVPEGKNITWNKLVTKYLPAPKKKDTAPLPPGKFAVIYADPPWPVGSMVMEKWESPIEDKYPTMELDAIAALPVVDKAADDCSLFLWTTHTFLPDAFGIIEAWGFKYFCCITWNKGSGWTQNGFHKMTEFLLFAYKGTINVEQHGKAIPTLIAEGKGPHSKKPDTIRDLIKDKTPGPRLEMFAREEHEGWVPWGDEV